MVGEWAELRFRSRIEDRGSPSRNDEILDPRSSILDPRSPFFNPRPSSLDPQSSILDPRSSILDPRSSILDPRSSILDPLWRVPLFPRVAAFSIRPNASV